jgi:hypothetical protein
MKIWPNLCGSMFLCLPLRALSLSIYPSRPPATSRKGKGAAKKSSVKKKDGVKSPQSPTSPGTSDPSLEVITEEKAELFLWERDEGYFVREATVSARIVWRKGANFAFFLTATSQAGQVLAHRISSQMMQRWSAATWSLTWNNINESGNQSSWCLRFESQEAFEDFRAEFTKRAWETLNQISWDKVKVSNSNSRNDRHIFIFLQADERAYVINANVEDVEMAVETDEDEEEAVLDELGGKHCSAGCFFSVLHFHHAYCRRGRR